MSDTQKFLDTFPSNHASFTQGLPTGETKLTEYGPKIIYRYTNVKRQFNRVDVRLHRDGKVAIVANPLLQNGTCLWAAAECDKYNRMTAFTPPEDFKDILNFFRSKSFGVHGFLFLTRAWPADIVRHILTRMARQLAWWPCEINPKQTQLTADAPHGNGINLPFFGLGHVPDNLIRYTIPPEEMWAGGDSQAQGDEVARPKEVGTGTHTDDSGYWWDEPLVVMLEAFKSVIPDFEFRRVGAYYEVPCPGNRELGGWLDGSIHSIDEPILSDKTVVFIRNGWPKFKCMHAHCDGAFGEKKTINDWRKYFDPGYAIFDIEGWLDECAERGQQ